MKIPKTFKIKKCRLCHSPKLKQIHNFGNVFVSNFVNKKLHKIKEYEISTCVLKSNSGVIAVINNSRHCSFGMDQRIEIFGTKGMMISGNKRIDETETFIKSSTGSKKSFLNFFIERYGPSYKLQLNYPISHKIPLFLPRNMNHKLV